MATNYRVGRGGIRNLRSMTVNICRCLQLISFIFLLSSTETELNSYTKQEIHNSKINECYNNVCGIKKADNFMLVATSKNNPKC